MLGRHVLGSVGLVVGGGGLLVLVLQLARSSPRMTVAMGMSDVSDLMIVMLGQIVGVGVVLVVVLVSARSWS